MRDDHLTRLRLIPSVARPEEIFGRVQGSWPWDSAGRADLDFTQGWAVDASVTARGWWASLDYLQGVECLIRLRWRGSR